MHVGNQDYTSNCTGQPETLSAGVLTGRIAGLPSGVTLENEIIAERLLNNCQVLRSNPPLTVSPPGAILISIDYAAGWRTSVWLGAWVVIDSVATNWQWASLAEYGQEIWFWDASDIGKLTVPVSFGHKATLRNKNNTRFPWYNSVLPNGLSGYSSTITDPPWHVMDVIGGDFTSISSCTNCTN